MNKMKACFCILVASMMALPQALPQSFLDAEDEEMAAELVARYG